MQNILFYAHFCGFCAVFAIILCLGLNIWLMVETIYLFYEVYRFLVSAFCFVVSGPLKFFEVLQDNFFLSGEGFFIVFCSTIFLCKVRNERKKKRKKKKEKNQKNKEIRKEIKKEKKYIISFF